MCQSVAKMDYSKGKIYKIVADNGVYVGSTINTLHRRFKKHKYDLKKINLLTSIIWINMAPLHEYPFNNFLFNFGKYNLYKTLNVS